MTRASRAAATEVAAESRNTARMSAIEISRAPIIGPTRTPTRKVPPSRDIARARQCIGTASMR